MTDDTVSGAERVRKGRDQRFFASLRVTFLTSAPLTGCSHIDRGRIPFPVILSEAKDLRSPSFVVRENLK
jgi:hypothetical protein